MGVSARAKKILHRVSPHLIFRDPSCVVMVADTKGYQKMLTIQGKLRVV